MAAVGTVDPRGLEGRQEGENAAPRSRDFFWDSIVLFVVAAILALTAIDVVAEFIRGSSVECFLPNDTDARLPNVLSYVNQICASSLPLAEYLPAAITIHAILILAPHYVWLNMYGAKLDFFFQLTSQLVRTRDKATGEYDPINYVISEQLESGFTGSYRPNWMYKSYLLKLSIQLMTAAVGFALMLWQFSDFEESFSCPSDLTDTENTKWPLAGRQVMCVFTSLRLLGRINTLYLILLVLAIVCLFGAIIWCLKLHVSELGVRNMAKFSFESSLPFSSYVPQLPVLAPRWWPAIGSFVYSVLSYIPYCSLRHNSVCNIQSDYDFLVVKLFRTEGGLAHILREVHALRLLRDMNATENARINILKRQLPHDGKKKFASDEFLRGDIGWELESWGEAHKQLQADTLLSLPGNIRGAVLGLAGRCKGTIWEDDDEEEEEEKEEEVEEEEPVRFLSAAVCVCFGCESLGLAGALSQVFNRVGVIFFNPYYTDYTQPVKLNINSHTGLVTVTCPHDILMSGRNVEKRGTSGEAEETSAAQHMDESAETMFINEVSRIWDPELKRENVNDPLEFTTNYIVIAPISNPLQLATVNIFMEWIDSEKYMSKAVHLLALKPTEVAGKATNYCTYTPPTTFVKKTHRACVVQHPLPIHWPPGYKKEKEEEEEEEEEDEEKGTIVRSSGRRTQGVQLPLDELRDSFSWNVSVGNTCCVFDFTLYECKEQKESDEKEGKEEAAKKGAVKEGEAKEGAAKKGETRLIEE